MSTMTVDPTAALTVAPKARHEHIKIATVGNPGLHLSTWLGGVPAGGASGNTLGCVVQESSLKAGRCEGQPIQQRR